MHFLVSTNVQNLHNNQEDTIKGISVGLRILILNSYIEDASFQ